MVFMHKTSKLFSENTQQQTKDLNYEAINNNKSLVWVRGKGDNRSYDYNVQNDVDFSKLFLQTHMAQYIGFDDTCDLSALLSLIIDIDTFPQIVRTTAQTVFISRLLPLLVLQV